MQAPRKPGVAAWFTGLPTPKHLSPQAIMRHSEYQKVPTLLWGIHIWTAWHAVHFGTEFSKLPSLAGHVNHSHLNKLTHYPSKLTPPLCRYLWSTFFFIKCIKTPGAPWSLNCITRYSNCPRGLLNAVFHSSLFFIHTQKYTSLRYNLVKTFPLDTTHIKFRIKQRRYELDMDIVLIPL